MTRDEAKKLLPIIQAYSEGKEVEWLYDDGQWAAIYGPAFAGSPDKYRIKPEKRVLYVTVRPSGDCTVKHHHRPTAEPQRKCLACIRVEYEEGQFDE